MAVDHPMPSGIKNASSVVLPEAFMFDAYEPDNKKSVVIRTQCAPVFAPIQVDAFALLKETTAVEE